MSSFAQLLQSISQNEINRVSQENGFTRWSYFADEASSVVGVIGASDSVIAMYYISGDNTLKLGPLGVMQLNAISYKPDAEKLSIISNGQFLDVFVLNDLGMIGENGMVPNFDFSVAKQWQDFLASRGVKTVGVSNPEAVPGTGTNAPARPFLSRTQILIVAVIVIIVFTAVVIIEQPWNAGK